jgi:HEPN domain-containing protein
MPPDPQRMADTRAWLHRVDVDLRAAEVDLAAHPALLGDAAFHCQQAAEKALKAFLTWHDVPFRRIHDLAGLERQCVSIEEALEPACRRAQSLTPYAWVFRYPGEIEEPPREEIEAALRLAGDVYTAVLSQLPKEVVS